MADLKTLLHIPAGLNWVKIVYGTMHPDPGVVGIRTCSLMQILSTLGEGIEFLRNNWPMTGSCP